MIHPLIVMAIGIALVIGLIMWLRVNAFIALLIAAISVSLLTLEPVPQPTGAGDSTSQSVGYRLAGDAMSRVTAAFGETCGNIAIVIALAAVIGTCMMDSGAADRIVRAFMSMLGEKRAPWALMGSGYVLAIPVFFDTVFYLLVPLARSFYRRTGGAYLKCILAISAGGAITHTLVPPTPGPLTMAANLGIDMGTMILIGAMVALPAAIAGILVAGLLDRMFDIPMREVAGHEEPEPLADDQLPSLFASLLPVLLPVVMIALHTVASTLSSRELLTKAEVEAVAQGTTLDAQVAAIQAEAELAGKNVSKDEVLKQVKAETLAEYGAPGFFTNASRVTNVVGNPAFALLISTIIAMGVYIRQRTPSRQDVAKMVELSLMSGGVIILITAAGSAFGAMLKQGGVGDSIRQIAESTFGDTSPGTVMLFLGFGLASLLKIAQGSSTAAMIIVSGMMAGIIDGTELPYGTVYIATAIGAGSLVGSWMNDSGFWIFAKMGGLTEGEALKTWTPLLAVLGIVGMAATLVLSRVMP
ncbi:GntP family permease [Rosistilla oblonga]|uniref:GntP family permease n=1 Tax=Rosistilla oblonga TaxID=2527990 RepID=UPI003A9826BB